MPKKKTKRNPKPLADYTLADQIRTAREAAKLTRRQLAQKCKVDMMTLCRWEWGKNVPTSENIEAIAKTCGCDYVLAQLIPAQLLPAADGGTSATE